MNMFVILYFRSSTGFFCFLSDLCYTCICFKWIRYGQQIWLRVYCLIVTILKILDTKNMSSVTKAKMLNLVNCDVKNIKPCMQENKHRWVIYLAKFVIWLYLKFYCRSYPCKCMINFGFLVRILNSWFDIFFLYFLAKKQFLYLK